MPHPDAPMLDMDAQPSLASIVSENPAISSLSRWSEDVWRLDGEGGGQTAAQFSIHWSVKAPRKLMDEAKMLAALLFLERDGDRKLKHTTAGTFGAGMRHMLRFMAHHAYFSFAELDQDAFGLFYDNLAVKLSDPEWSVEEFGAEDEDADVDAEAGPDDDDAVSVEDEYRAAAQQIEFEMGETGGSESDAPADASAESSASGKGRGESDSLTRAAAYYRLRTWRQLFEMADDMGKAGCRPLAHNPFATTSIKEWTQKASDVATFLIPPLPDRVALRIMATAQRLIGRPADDVLELQRRYVGELLRLDREPTTAERKRLRAVVEGFGFGVVDGVPWHDPIILPDDRPGGGVEMKELITLIRDAALLIVLCGTGVRIGELCSIVADPTPREAPLPLLADEPTAAPDMPHCVATRVSKTGMNEHLFMTSRLFKNERKPKEETWLIGARPRGSDVEPPVLRALRVLEALYEPWRSLAADERTRSHLVLGLLGSGLPRSARGVAPVQAAHLRLSLREFIADRCGLAELEPHIVEDRRLRPYVEQNGRCIRPHQWRKTFALYMMKVDDRMVPALAHHFKHTSIAVTENSYMPSDPSMLAAQDSVHAQEAARWFYEQRHGAGGRFGRLDEIMQEHREEWEKLVSDLPFEDGLPQVVRFLVEKDVRIFHAEHGRCVIGANPDESRCHEAGGTSSWRNTRPNYATRTPGQCTGCTNYSVSGEHAGFWQRRYASYQGTWLGSDRSPQFRVVQKRAQQAAAVVKALGAPLPNVEVEPSGKGSPAGGAGNDPSAGTQGEAA